MGMNDDFHDAESCEGMEEGKSSIRAFLEMLKRSTEIEGEAQLELWNVGHGAEDAIYTTEWDISEPTEDVIDEIMDAAETDALNVGRGKVRFKVVVGGLKKAGRAAFTLNVPDNGDDLNPEDIEDIEELASRKGLLTQLMRHQEKTIKVGLGGAAVAQATLKSQLEAAYKRITDLEGRHLETVKVYEELLSAKHMRDLELRKLDNDERRKEQVAGILMQGFPILLNKFMSNKALPPGPATDATAPNKPFAPRQTFHPQPRPRHRVSGFLVLDVGRAWSYPVGPNARGAQNCLRSSAPPRGLRTFPGRLRDWARQYERASPPHPNWSESDQLHHAVSCRPRVPVSCQNAAIWRAFFKAGALSYCQLTGMANRNPEGPRPSWPSGHGALHGGCDCK